LVEISKLQREIKQLPGGELLMGQKLVIETGTQEENRRLSNYWPLPYQGVNYSQIATDYWLAPNSD